MALSKTVKQTYESYFIHADFENVMTNPETISSIDSLTVVDKDGTDVTTDLVETGTQSVGTGDNVYKVFFRIQNGFAAASPYKFTVKIITSTGNKWEVDGNIKVKEL